MKTYNCLLPYRFKKVGMWLFLPFTALCLYLLFGNNVPEISIPWFAILNNKAFLTPCKADLLIEVGMMGLLVSLCFISLSREKDEDEMTGQIRMRSFVWSMWLTAILLAVGILFVMDIAFMYFCFMALYFFFIVYILKFNFEMKAIRREGR